jgi:soluble lytic murein transglycosylase-like protein
VAQYPWDVATVIRIMKCESGFTPGAVSPDGANHGLMQVNNVHLWRVGGDVNALYDPATNIRVAYAIYQDAGGFGPWSCY